jgi:hypothetical protein
MQTAYTICSLNGLAVEPCLVGACTGASGFLEAGVAALLEGVPISTLDVDVVFLRRAENLPPLLCREVLPGGAGERCLLPGYFGILTGTGALCKFMRL